MNTASPSTRIASNQKTKNVLPVLLKVNPDPTTLDPVMILSLEGETNGKRVCHRKATEERTRSSREAVVRIECGPRRLCRSIRSQANTQAPAVVSEGQSEDCRRAKSTMGEGSSEEKKLILPTS